MLSQPSYYVLYRPDGRAPHWGPSLTFSDERIKKFAEMFLPEERFFSEMERHGRKMFLASGLDVSQISGFSDGTICGWEEHNREKSALLRKIQLPGSAPGMAKSLSPVGNDYSCHNMDYCEQTGVVLGMMFKWINFISSMAVQNKAIEEPNWKFDFYGPGEHNGINFTSASVSMTKEFSEFAKHQNVNPERIEKLAREMFEVHYKGYNQKISDWKEPICQWEGGLITSINLPFYRSGLFFDESGRAQPYLRAWNHERYEDGLFYTSILTDWLRSIDFDVEDKSFAG